MIDDEDIYDFLEHAGVKGMRWGVKRAKNYSPGPRFRNRSTGQKAIVSGAAGVGALTGLFMTRYLNTPVRAIGVGAFTFAGAKAAEKLLDKHGDTRLNKSKN